VFIIAWENYSGNNSCFSTIFLNFFVLIVFIFEKSCSSSEESSLELVSESYDLNPLSENDHASGSYVLITINSIF
jgi:hypothetical protein